jgi:murein DD-endopeptidase MepM/ murein hydrolase activator NlpD
MTIARVTRHQDLVSAVARERGGALVVLLAAAAALGGCAAADAGDVVGEAAWALDEADGAAAVLFDSGTTRPALRSPLASYTRISEHVSHETRRGRVDYSCSRQSRRHRGTDFATPRGTPVYASHEGTVISREVGCPDEGSLGSRCGGSFGNHVIVWHPSGRATLYAHLQRSGVVALGATVRCGDLLGRSGNSGRSSGPHLHYEVRDGVTSPTRAAFFAVGAKDPFGGPCSTQTASLWAGGGGPSATCTGTTVGPRDDAGFVAASPARREKVAPGQVVRGRVTLRNTGSTTWSTSAGYAAVSADAPRVSALSRLALPGGDVAPGEQAAFDVALTAPDAPGRYALTYRMARGDDAFGATVRLEIEVVAPSAPRACTSATLGRSVPHGACVQVARDGCGMDSCSWWKCTDGAWGCTDESTCAADRMPNAACGGAGEPPPGLTSCAREGRACRTAADCCSDGAGNMQCLSGFCTDVSMCRLPPESCDTRADCCGPVACAAKTFGGAAQCCFEAGDACTTSAECCGEMTCDGGRCACRPRGASCASSRDCCGGGYCDRGVCAGGT